MAGGAGLLQAVEDQVEAVLELVPIVIAGLDAFGDDRDDVGVLVDGEAGGADAQEAGLLETVPGAPVLRYERLLSGPGRRPLAWDGAVLRADRARFRAEYLTEQPADGVSPAVLRGVVRRCGG